MGVAAPKDGPPRRAVIAAPGAAGMAALLAACGGDGGQPAVPPADLTGAPAARTGTPPGSPTPGGGTPPGSPGRSGGAGTRLAKVSDIPVGGGKIFETQGVVVTQPRAGTIRAFAAACPHQGCSVTRVGTTIDCVCHRSRFDLADGSVVGGPAPSGLPPVPVRVTGGQITLL